jgi:hypothetical protein
VKARGFKQKGGHVRVERRDHLRTGFKVGGHFEVHSATCEGMVRGIRALCDCTPVELVRR